MAWDREASFGGKIRFYHFIVFIMGKKMRQHMPSGAIYGLGLIGAAIYFIGTATSFGL